MQHVFPFFNFMHFFCVLNVYLIIIYYEDTSMNLYPTLYGLSIGSR
jgi:hypothetical protein